MKVWLAKRVYRLALLWWWAWSHVFRARQRRSLPAVKLLHDLTPEQVQALASHVTWRADGAFELWDACAAPEWFQHNLNRALALLQPLPGGLDCDDFAAWCAAVVAPVHEPAIVTVAWTSRSGAIQGHVVCAVRTKDGLRHLGNWGMSRPFQSYEALVMAILDRGLADECIGWAVLDQDLWPTRWSTTTV